MAPKSSGIAGPLQLGKRTRVYFQIEDRFVRFITIHPIKEDQFHLQPHGLTKLQPALAGRWEDREHLSVEETAGITWAYDDSYEPYEVGAVDYISWHPEAMCFRVQLSDKKSLDVKSDTSLDRFIDGMFLSDLPSRYEIEGKPDADAVILQAQRSAIWVLRFSVSIGEHDLSEHSVLGAEIREKAPGQKIRLWMRFFSVPVSSETMANRPRGTILSLRFFEPNDLFSSKSLILR